jgi:DNA-binding NarL/FixJ family response regulator
VVVTLSGLLDQVQAAMDELRSLDEDREPRPIADRGPTGDRPRPGVHLLTEREAEVLAQMATGRSNAAIAARLCVNLKTVEAHASAIFSKLGLVDDAGVNRRVAAVLAWQGC